MIRNGLSQFLLHQVLDILMDLALVLVEDTVYVRRRVGSRTFEVGDLWDCFVVGGLVVEDYFTAEGLVLDFLFEGVLLNLAYAIHRKSKIDDTGNLAIKCTTLNSNSYMIL